MVGREGGDLPLLLTLTSSLGLGFAFFRNDTAIARTACITAFMTAKAKFEIRAISSAVVVREETTVVVESLISSATLLLLLLVLDLGGGRGTPLTTGGGSTTEFWEAIQ